MSVAKRSAGLGAALVSLFLAACGGGGSSPSPTSPPPYAVSPNAAQVTAVAGYATQINFTATQTTSYTGTVYIGVTADAAVVQNTVSVTINPDNTAFVSMVTLASLAVGHYTGNFTVNACTDAACSHSLAGAPFKVPYDITVVPAEGSVSMSNRSALAPLTGGLDWGTFQGNSSHSGFVPVTLDASTFNRRWTWTVPSFAGQQWILSTLVTGGDMFYVSTQLAYNIDASIGNGVYSLYAYREDDCSQVWSHSFDDLLSPSTNPPAYSDGRVYIVAGSANSGAMFGFDAASGTQVFRTSTSSQGPAYLAPTVFGGTVYNDGGDFDGPVAFDATTGLEKFGANPDWGDGSTPAVDSTRVYVYTEGALYVHDNQTGAVIARISDGTTLSTDYTSIAEAPVVGGPDIVYAESLLDVNTHRNSITSFDVSNDSVRWAVSGRYIDNPVYAHAVLYAANQSPFELEALAEGDGSKLWTWTPPAGDVGFVSDVLVTSNLAFVSGYTGTYAIDLTTHKTVWHDAASGKLALSANGILYIQDINNLVAINLH